MLTGMGLALGIDYALFVISRYREERGRGPRAARRDLRHGRDREPRRPLQRLRVRGRDVRAADRPVDDLPQPRRRRDPRRDHLGRSRRSRSCRRCSGCSRDRVDSLRLPYLRPAAARARRTRRAGFWGGDRRPRPAPAGAEPRARRPRSSSRSPCPPSACSIGTRGCEHVPGRARRRSAATSPSSATSRRTRPTPAHILVVGTISQRRGRRLRDRARRRPALRPRRDPARATAAIADLVVPVRGDPAGDEAIERRARPPRAARSRGLRGHRRGSARRRHDLGEHRLLRQRHRPGAARVRVRARAVASSC